MVCTAYFVGGFHFLYKRWPCGHSHCTLVLTGRRLLSAPLINSLSDVGSSAAAAALGGNVETPSLHDFPSPASSAAEALELDTITFGQDATDLLDPNTSAGGHN